jgi:alkylhydroperoxidase family enzyme
MVTEIVTPRITPLEPPYDPRISGQLEKMMPAGVPPIALFRTFVRNLPMTEAMHGWGSYELSRGLTLSLRDREIVIDRTCARCACEYEWGVHVAFFAERAGLNPDQVHSLVTGGPHDKCWTDQRDGLLIQAVDSLHDAGDVDDDLWASLAAEFSDANLLDLLFLCGWYHTISFVARTLRVPLESGAPRFAPG